VTSRRGIPAGSVARPPRPDPAVLLYAARALRDFGDGFVAVLLAVYLTELGFTPLVVGMVASAALLGSSLMTLAIGVLARPGAQRNLLIAASALMTMTGLAFALANDLAVLLLVAFVGTINPSAGNASIFVPMEHALLAGSAEPARRTRMFAIYGLTGALAASLGSLAAGTPEFLAAAGVSRLGSLRGMFVLYAILGIAGGACYRLIPA
jgi:MFS family permease